MKKNQLELWSNLNEKNTLQEVQEYIKKVIEIRKYLSLEMLHKN